jgi:Glycosyl transferase family 90
MNLLAGYYSSRPTTPTARTPRTEQQEPNDDDNNNNMMAAMVTKRTSGGTALMQQQRSLSNHDHHHHHHQRCVAGIGAARAPAHYCCYRGLFVFLALTVCLSLSNFVAILQQTVQGRQLRISTVTTKDEERLQRLEVMIPQQQTAETGGGGGGDIFGEQQLVTTGRGGEVGGEEVYSENKPMLAGEGGEDPKNELAPEQGDSEKNNLVEGGGEGHGEDFSGSTDSLTTHSSSQNENTTSTSSASSAFQICETTRTETSIRSYLSMMEYPEDWLLLKWKADGSLDHDRVQNSTHYQGWRPSATLLGDTVPSTYGRVVLLLNSDRTAMSNQWQVVPPVPVWVYSKPTSTSDPRTLDVSHNMPERCEVDQVSMVPTFYDTGNWNKACVDHVNNNVVRRHFTDKINKVVWRGAIHSVEVEKGRVALFDYVEKMTTTTTTTWSSAVDEWLNVKVTGGKDEPGFLDVNDLAEYRYQLDLGGLSGTAWGGLRWKLCAGLLVFRVETWANDWWYDTLTPWTHYIPIKADVSDLYEQYLWTQNHPDQAEAMAVAGRDKCLETFGPDISHQHFQLAIQALPAATLSIIQEAEALLDEMNRLNTGLEGIVLPEIAATASALLQHPTNAASA